ncbi:glycosyltransferase [Brachybacterium sp. GPGPB12]|uniref:glycosyltransferase n=1 Tax=Brachybacterium sp. GPGPB12 TaxID=3023517 RepID=UPI00313429C6
MSAAGPLTAHRPERVAVVIPAKNEAERIEATIASARGIPGVDLVVVVDDGSSDATSAVAMGAGALVVRHKTNRGKAAAMATGAQMVAIQEGAERADGGEGFSEEPHAEPRSPGHTGPPPVIDDRDAVPRALLFLDADMGESAAAARPLVEAVLGEGVDMAIALPPPQSGAGGMGVVVRTARRGILRATGWEATRPLSGTRCITRETWDACQPLAPGWGVETSLTIDALTAGFWVKEIPADLHHRATGNDLRGRLHRAAQLRDVARALARTRHLSPEIEGADEEQGAGEEKPAGLPAAALEREEPVASAPAETPEREAAEETAPTEPEPGSAAPSDPAPSGPAPSAGTPTPLPTGRPDHDEAKVWAGLAEPAEPDAELAERAPAHPRGPPRRRRVLRRRDPGAGRCGPRRARRAAARPEGRRRLRARRHRLSRRHRSRAARRAPGRRARRGPLRAGARGDHRLPPAGGEAGDPRLAHRAAHARGVHLPGRARRGRRREQLIRRAAPWSRRPGAGPAASAARSASQIPSIAAISTGPVSLTA